MGLSECLVHSRQETSGELAKTLRGYINPNHNQKATARVLHIHPSTLIYWVNKLEQLLGVDLNDSEQMVHLELNIILLEGSK